MIRPRPPVQDASGAVRKIRKSAPARVASASISARAKRSASSRAPHMMMQRRDSAPVSRRRPSSPSIGITAEMPVPVAPKRMSPGCAGVEHEEAVRTGHVQHRPERKRHQELRGLALGDHPDDEPQDLACVALGGDRIAAAGDRVGAWRVGADRHRDELSRLEGEPGRRAEGEGELGDVGGNRLAGDELRGEGGWHRRDHNRGVLASPNVELRARKADRDGPGRIPGCCKRWRLHQEGRGRQAVQRPSARSRNCAERARRGADRAASHGGRARRPRPPPRPPLRLRPPTARRVDHRLDRPRAGGRQGANQRAGRSTWWRAGSPTIRPRAARSSPCGSSRRPSSRCRSRSPPPTCRSRTVRSTAIWSLTARIDQDGDPLTHAKGRRLRHAPQGPGRLARREAGARPGPEGDRVAGGRRPDHGRDGRSRKCRRDAARASADGGRRAASRPPVVAVPDRRGSGRLW